MILIPRKAGVLISLLALILSLALSFVYFSKETYVYLSKLEQKFSQVRQIYRNISQLEQEGKQLEKIRASVYAIQGAYAKDGIEPERLKERLEEFLSGKILLTDYIIITSSVSEPIHFKKVPITYTLIIRGTE
uniref:Uncharacterized protein n=1 Tax=Fervidobacterium pennivorans TaxID=93466 RepID=A0A7V4KC87_FERPE